MLFTFLIPLSKGGLNSILFSILIVDIILFFGSQYYLKTKIKQPVISQLKNLKMIFLSSIPILITPSILGGYYLKLNLIGLILVIFANFISYIILIYSLDRKLFSEFMKLKTIAN